MQSGIKALALLQLLQLADSAVPVGGTAHSFGLETLVEDGAVTAQSLEAFLASWLDETGFLEGVFCRAASVTSDWQTWRQLQGQLGAFKPARESREASVRLGRRFLALAADLTGQERLKDWAERETDLPSYYPTVFGLVGNALGLDELTITSTYLHSAVGSLIWAGQRLLPVGQNQASRLWWRLKPTILAIAERSQTTWPHEVTSFTPLLDTASMRHPDLPTRLFIS